MSERRKLPRERRSLTHKFEVGGHEGYIIVGLYDDGTPGEIFLEGFGKDGSFIQCMMGVWAKSMSTAIQYGQPLEKIVSNYLGMHFDPCGVTPYAEIPMCRSIPDYIARWLALKFLDDEQYSEVGLGLRSAA